MKKNISLLILLLGIFFTFSWFLSYNSLQEQRITKDFIVIDNDLIRVELADDHSERVRGLSGKSELKHGHGLLFVFDRPDFHGIWMKDMNFAIDILWFDESQTLVDIEENVSPNTYPMVFEPEIESLYVLELNAGSAERYNIKEGDQFSFEK